jgi:hypothetical protein
MASGHFPGLPALPVAILCANACNCISFFDVKHVFVISFKVRCQRLVLLGESVVFRAERVKPGLFNFMVFLAHSGAEIGNMSITIHIDG